MNLMNDLLADCPDDFVMVFFDDILIYSKTLKDHVVHLMKVLQRKSPPSAGVISSMQRHQSVRLHIKASSSLGSR